MEKFSFSQFDEGAALALAHSFDPFEQQLDQFCTETGFIRVPERDHAQVVGDGKVLFFPTFKSPRGNFFIGGFGAFHTDKEFKKVRDAKFLPATDESFTFFSEFFGFNDTFAARKFRFFSNVF